jgi:hypothetical protein
MDMRMHHYVALCVQSVAYPEIVFGGWEGFRQEFFSGWEVQQIQLRTQGVENGDLGAVAP